MIRWSLAICVTLVLCITIVRANGPATAPGRTLEPNAVWSIFGGAEFQDICCRQPSGLCDMADKDCTTPAEIPCWDRAYINSAPGNRKLCHGLPPQVSRALTRHFINAKK